MRVIQDLSTASFDKKTIVTIGTFDGVHLGHQKIIHRLQTCSSTDTETVLITFSNHPKSVLNNKKNIQLLNTNEEKIEILRKLRIDNLVILEFNQALSELSGEEFVKEILVDKLKIHKIIIGYDHRFGKNRSSDIHDLIRLGQKYHFDVEQISAQELDEITISSTKIRQALNEGNIKQANDYLGYPYIFQGKVVKGNQLGRTIGFPTANICIENPQKLVPKNGVYIVQVQLNDQIFQGMMNIGNRPTIDGVHTTIEVHLLNCNFEFYESTLKVNILDFIREEQKFDSLASLQNQLQQDKNTTINFFNKTK
ncbi:bifunctional riboflavin kinase/FAD synthetase [Flavobacterium sp.]|uniref:bifunctional riboflavin kinase/FAD synthetase n=1 Tax=Flavobacterium sp. TaxID=239 RepID=UPI003D0C6B96